jgi:mRNA-degrading endonuclease toxin of MazEF toxin-antitoxin module
VVVSNSEQNAILPSVVVVPVSSRPPEIEPLRLGFHISGLKPSFAVIPGLRQISKARVQSEIGLLSEADTARLDRALALYLRDP